MESYLQNAMNIFSTVLNFLSTTTILTVGGVSITFLGLGCFVMAFSIISYIIQAIFYGE